MSCRLSARGHRWQPPKLAAQRLRPAPHVRACECGAIGFINKQGVVEIEWEPPAGGTLALVHPCDRDEIRAIVLELGELEVEHRAGDRGTSSYLAAREQIVTRLARALG